MNAKCPKCGGEFAVEITAVVPDEQVFYMELKSESEFFAAKTIGKTLSNMEAILREVAAGINEKVVVFLKSIELKPNHIKMGLIIAKSDTKPEITPAPVPSDPDADTGGSE